VGWRAEWEKGDDPSPGCPRRQALLLVIAIVLIVLHGVLTPEQFRVALLIAAAAFIVGVIALWTLAYKIFSNPNSRLGRYFVLWKEERAEDGYTASPDQLRNMVGRRGVAVSKLRPSGTGQFGRERLSVVSEAEFIEQGAEIEIASVEGSRVVVRRAEPPGGDQNGA
jgi:membrane-bound serine protease (ClpP class)